MKFIACVIMVYGAIIACVVAAGLLAASQCDGWGWFLLVAAILCHTSISGEEKSKKDDD